MELIHLVVSSELKTEFLQMCFTVYETRDFILEKEKDEANDILKNLILHSMDSAVSNTYSDFIQEDNYENEGFAVGHTGSTGSQIELVFQIILFWHHLLAMLKNLHTNADALMSKIRGSNSVCVDEDCEAALFMNSDEDLVDRFEHASMLVKLSYRKKLMLQLESTVIQKVLCPLVNLLLCSKHVNDKLSDKLSGACDRRQKSHDKNWNPLFQKVNFIFKTLHSDFWLRYGNEQCRKLEDIMVLIPSERAYATARAAKHKRLEALNTPVHRPAKKPRQLVDIYNLNVDEQVQHRCAEQTAERMLNYFGAVKSEELDLRKCYKGFYSKKYGNIIVLEGFGLVPVNNSTDNLVESSVARESLFSIEVEATECNSIVTNKCDPEWTSRVLITLRSCVDEMSIYIDASQHLSMRQSFESYVRLYLDGQFFPRHADYNVVHSSHQEVVICRRSLTLELHTFVTRLFREYKLFNPRTLDGNNNDDCSDLHTRFIMYKVLTNQLESVNNVLDKIETQISLLEAFVCKTGKLTLNTGLVICLIMRNISLTEKDDCNTVKMFVTFWIDIIDLYFSPTSCDDTGSVCVTDQVHFLRMYVCLNVLTPIPAHQLFRTVIVKTGNDQNNDENFVKHMQQQNCNISSLSFVSHTSNQIINKNTKNSDLYLCGLALHSSVIKHWWIGCIHKFTVRNNTRNSFTNMIVSLFPRQFVDATIALLAHCFLYEPVGCYVTSIRLSCALIGFIKQWAFDCNVTASSCTGTAWSPCKVYKTVFHTLTLCREDCMTSVHIVVNKILPELKFTLTQNMDSKETEGYIVIDTACKDIQYVLDMEWYL